MTVNMPASCSVHALRMHPRIPSGLPGIERSKDLSHVDLKERDHPVLWVSDGPHTQHYVVIVKACMKCIEFVFYIFLKI